MEGIRARRVRLKVSYKSEKKSTDITEDIEPFLIEAEYTDNMSDEADELRLVLDDSKEIWLKEWLPPSEGDQLEVSVETENRVSKDEGLFEWKLGSFEISEVEASPNRVEFKCVSIVGQASLRSEKRNQTWEKVSLKQIVNEIAYRNGLQLMYEGPTKELDHIEQTDESDLEFLLKQARSEGLTLKVTPETLIMVDEATYEMKPETIEVKKALKREKQEDIPKLTWFIEWRFRQKTKGIYDKCIVRSQKTKKKEMVEGSFSIKDGKKILHIKEQVKDSEEAKALAKKKLREANKDEVTGNFSTVLNLNFMAGNTVRVKEFGVFDGKYIIERCRHSIVSMRTDVEIRRCLNGY